VYKGASPDEVTLVEFSSQLVFVLTASTQDKATVLVEQDDINYDYTVYRRLEFSSDRKRMSVLVRGADKQAMLLIKGADNVITDRLAPHQNHSVVSSTMRFIHNASI
jgi:phospholipid-translocating ATPase